VIFSPPPNAKKPEAPNQGSPGSLVNQLGGVTLPFLEWLPRKEKNGKILRIFRDPVKTRWRKNREL